MGDFTKTFEKWLEKSNYEFDVCHWSFRSECRIRGDKGSCLVVFNHLKNKGCLVYDEDGYVRSCKNIQEAIEKVNFLAGGEC